MTLSILGSTVKLSRQHFKAIGPGYRRAWNSMGPFTNWESRIGFSNRITAGTLKFIDLALVPVRPEGKYLENLRVQLINKSAESSIRFSGIHSVKVDYKNRFILPKAALVQKLKDRSVFFFYIKDAELKNKTLFLYPADVWKEIHSGLSKEKKEEFTTHSYMVSLDPIKIFKRLPIPHSAIELLQWSKVRELAVKGIGNYFEISPKDVK